MVKGGSGHRRTQAERSAVTTDALVGAARALFATKGYAASGREEIVAAAGVTRGAMYHHFADKADLFRAVYEQLEGEVMQALAEAAGAAGDDPVEQLRLGCAAYLDLALDEGVRRICIIDAPSVLGEEARREINERYALGMIRQVVEAAMDAGAIAPQSVDALAHVLLASVMAAAQYVATADDPTTARREAGQTLDHFLDGLTT